jgi:DHA1 family bicyclomycin/chloramphenicol resistance-like MFS transporter
MGKESHISGGKTFVLVYLGALSAFGPFVMDMYVPVLPAMQDWFDCPVSKVQLGLTTGLVGLAVGQLIFGPVSDRYVL